MAKKKGSKKGSKKGGMGKGACMALALALGLATAGCSLLGMSSGGAVAGTSAICAPDPTGNHRCSTCLTAAEAKVFNVGKLIADWAPAIPVILASMGHPNPTIAEVTNAIAAMSAAVRTEPCAGTPA